MEQTNLVIFITYALQRAENIFTTRINELSLSILYMLLGFFISTTLSTIPGQTGDWGIIGAAMIVTVYERISRYTYSFYIVKHKYSHIMKTINNVKIGILYGLFVDAFKLGS
uniref:Uncharacterized protein ycf20 n=1 Tax=Liagoropsis maxima TaxID=1653392 RepID=A0A1G4NVK8_9FLOR|nr:Hypothetical protein ycf20 [Liagoropsis maxima]SCW22743.1 Hypothetical protein ycf20 [Liagoropsis maxima]